MGRCWGFAMISANGHQRLSLSRSSFQTRRLFPLRSQRQNASGLHPRSRTFTTVSARFACRGERSASVHLASGFSAKGPQPSLATNIDQRFGSLCSQWVALFNWPWDSASMALKVSAGLAHCLERILHLHGASYAKRK